MPNDAPIAKAFDPNAPMPGRAGMQQARLPRPSGVAGNFAVDADTYLSAIQKGFHDIDTSTRAIAKALGVSPQAYSYARIAYMPDVANSGLLQWPGINPESLRKIARDNVAPLLITNTRVSDMARYAQFSSRPQRPGWKIELMDAGRSPSKAEMADILEAQRFIYNCNIETGYDEARKRDAHMVAPFEQYCRATTRDLFTFDSLATWTAMDDRGQVKQFTALPAGNVRLADPRRGYKGDKDKFAALLDEAMNPITAFTREELTWRVMNPRTEPEAYGYGWPCWEQAVRLIQGFQSAIDLNCDTFVRNGIPEAIIALMGDYWSDEQMDLLLREWQNMKNGISKSWGLPFLNIPEDGDIKILPLNDIKGEDLRYKDHLNLMGGCACIVAQFPPRRLGLFASGQRRDNQPLPDESVEEQGTDDPGLPPLLSFMAETINQYFLWSRWPHLRFVYTNMDPKTDAREYEAKRNARTWKESRAEEDLPPLAKLLPKGMEQIAEIMEACPEDPAKSAVFATVAVTMLKAKLGIKDGGGAGTDGGEAGTRANEETPGPRMLPKKDPAVSRVHGHRAGIRRNSRQETAGGARGKSLATHPLLKTLIEEATEEAS